jgi:hypothetical protein
MTFARWREQLLLLHALRLLAAGDAVTNERTQFARTSPGTIVVHHVADLSKTRCG